eukprot:1611163-Pyramimonas_sp.AAC.1
MSAGPSWPSPFAFDAEVARSALFDVSTSIGSRSSATALLLVVFNCGMQCFLSSMGSVHMFSRTLAFAFMVTVGSAVAKS